MHRGKRKGILGRQDNTSKDLAVMRNSTPSVRARKSFRNDLVQWFDSHRDVVNSQVKSMYY